MLLSVAGVAWAALPATEGDAAVIPGLDAGFEEPFVRTAATSRDEDAALTGAVAAYRHGAADDFAPLEGFLAAHTQSGWRLALLTNLGLSYYRAGYFSRAIDAFEQAWPAGRTAETDQARALADRAAGELLKMHARLGHADRLQALMDQLGDRGLSGQATELRDGAVQGLWEMRNDPGVAYLCGPMALKNLLLTRGASHQQVAFLDNVRSSPHGVTLAEVGRLADQAALPHRLVYRTAGQPVPVPAIVHWKVNHFAAIIGERNGRYELTDPTFGQPHMWVSRRALDAEGSGYFLVAGDQPGGAWRDVPADEAEQVFGMGYTGSNDPGHTSPGDCGCGGKSNSSGGMTTYSFTEMVVSLRLSDTPVGYQPPKGPAVPVTISYEQREAGQPSNFRFFNVSPKWSLNWLSYIVDDPTNSAADVTRVIAGGGFTVYAYDTSTNRFVPNVDDASVLSRNATSSVSYTRTMPDGSREIYARSNGATGGSRLVFLTKVIDPAGNAVTLAYDGLLRLTRIVDATGRATTFSYDLPGAERLLVTKITDPFGRFAALSYDSKRRLASITDVFGLTSSFVYAGSQVTRLSTPYGTTKFSFGGGTAQVNSRFLQATDPLGHIERLEFSNDTNVSGSDPINTVPAPFAGNNEYLNYRDTFYWNKHAYAVGHGDYTKARNRHWAHLASDGNLTSDTLESVKNPLENRIWFNYPGQAGAIESGTLNKPTAIGRVLDNGGTQLQQMQYNGAGNISSVIDPVGRQTVLGYAANRVDVTSVQQNTTTGPATLARFTYNARHLPLTYTDASGQVTKFAYNADGQLTQRTDALGRVTKYIYDTLGYLTTIVNADGKTADKFAYDAAGRVKTLTDSEGWAVFYTYDAFDRVLTETYPDRSTRRYVYDNLDLKSITDRQGRTTSMAYDADRNLLSVTDPDGKLTQFGYYEDGTLKTLADPNGNLTRWTVDLESRPTAKTYADGKTTGYGYEATSSRLLFVSDPIGQIRQFGYTLDDRLAAIQHYNAVHPTPDVGFTYDPYFPLLTSMTDGTGTTQYSYQPVGALGALQLMTEQGPYANSAIAYQYDRLGRPAQRSVGGDVETIGYDALGRVAAHTDDLGAFTRTYLGETNQLSRQTNGKVGTVWDYLPNSGDRRLKEIVNGANATTYGFTTQPEGDITGITDSHNKVTWTNTYDALDRLTGASPSTGASYKYGYDTAGNLDTIQRPGGTTTVTPNRLNQVTEANGKAFAYDVNGNLVRDYARTYEWDADNRLIAIGYLANPGVRTTFRYDGRGRRAAIDEVNGKAISETRYLWCGETLCQSRSAKDAVLRRYLAEGEASSTAALYYAVDQLGSVRDVLVAGTGASATHYDYEPYGTPTGAQKASATDFRYAGLFYHQQSGLYLANYRAYDPSVSRWITQDPIGTAGGTNLYSYVAGDPVDNNDPVGLMCVQGKGCWTTPLERAFLTSGNYLKYYETACEGGDDYACFAQHIAANDNFWGHRATARLIDALNDNANENHNCGDISGALDKIRSDLANSYADYLPDSENKAMWPNAHDIAQLHWSVFSRYGLPPSTFGGSPEGQGWLFIPGTWCPNCTGRQILK